MASRELIRALRTPENEALELEHANRLEFIKDLGRNTVGLGELGLSMGTGMVEMAGRGLGTLAGMAGSKLRGEDVDWNAASEVLRDDMGAATYAPRTTAGQEYGEALAAPMEAIDDWMLEQGGKVSDLTGSPALGAAAYTGMSMVDPTILIPGGIATKGLRGASRVARSVDPVEVPSTGFGGRQRGAYSPGDLAKEPGDFALRSPLIDAFEGLKPQEQGRLPGRQLLQVKLEPVIDKGVPVLNKDGTPKMAERWSGALIREGAKADELRWSGLDKVLDTDELVNVADVQALALRRAPKIIFDEASGAKAGLLEDRVVMASEDMAMENAVAAGIDWNSLTPRQQEFEISKARAEIETDYEAYLGPEYADISIENAFGEYTVGGSGDLATLTRPGERFGFDSEAPPGYGIELARVQREGRYGRDRSNQLPDDQQPSTALSELERVAMKLPEGVVRNRELARIQALRADPWIEKAHKQALASTIAPDSHFPENFLHMRTSRRGIPEWGTTEAALYGGEFPTRLIEEAQSDLHQGARDSGYVVPEEMGPKLAQRAEERAIAVTQLAPRVSEALDRYMVDPKVNRTLQEIMAGTSMDTPPWMHQAIVARMNNLKEVADGTIKDPARIMEIKQQMLSSINELAAHSHAGAQKWGPKRSNAIIKEYADLQKEYDAVPARGEDGFYDRVPGTPMSDTKQYMALALRRQLSEAVKSGEQFLAWAPGDIHTTRYGAPAISWKTNADGTVSIRNTEIGPEGTQRGMENAAAVMQRRVDLGRLTFDPNDLEAVENAMDSLGRGDSHDYVDISPANLVKLIGKNPAGGTYSPRAQGNVAGYGAMEKDLAKILRETGSKAEIRDIDDYGLPLLLEKQAAEHPRGEGALWQPKNVLRNYRGGNISREKYIEALRSVQAARAAEGIETEIRPRTVRGIEIDPELARAVKLGLKLPY